MSPASSPSLAENRTHSPKEPDALFYRERFSFREVWTNPDTGAWIVFSGAWLGADVTAKRVEDNVYEYTIIQAGRPFVVEDSTGSVIAHERGVLRFHVLFDTERGTSSTSSAWTSAAPTPASTRICRYAADLIGMDNSTSSQRYTLHPDGSTESPLGYAEYLPPSYE